LPTKKNENYHYSSGLRKRIRESHVLVFRNRLGFFACTKKKREIPRIKKDALHSLSEENYSMLKRL